MATVRPFLLLRDSDKPRIAAAVEELMRGWLRRWWTGEPSLAVAEVFPLDDGFDGLAHADVTMAVRADDGAVCMFAIDAAAARALACALLGDDEPPLDDRRTPIEHDLLAAALEDGLRQVSAAEGRAEQVADGQPFLAALSELAAPGRGGVGCVVYCGGVPLTVMLSGSLLADLWQREHSAKPSELLTALPDVLRHCQQARVRAEITLGEAEITVGALSSVRVGDVISLDACVDEPVALRFEGCDNVLLGYLGTHNGALAIQVSDGKI